MKRMVNNYLPKIKVNVYTVKPLRRRILKECIYVTTDKHGCRLAITLDEEFDNRVLFIPLSEILEAVGVEDRYCTEEYVVPTLEYDPRIDPRKNKKGGGVNNE